MWKQLQRYAFCALGKNLNAVFFVNFSKKYVNKTSYSTFRTLLCVDYLISPKEIVYLQKKRGPSPNPSHGQAGHCSSLISGQRDI